MRIDDIHQVVKSLLRIVLPQLHEHVIGVLRLAAHHELADGIRQLIVHDRIHRIAHEELGSILPDFA